jgi:nitroimidazol reductase NimA-like FMN-containing flavoprotein (pyridoxamine 5'-phosphate oxidase superfamily)
MTGKYDFATVNKIIDQAPILHVAFSPGGNADDHEYPAILPMLGCTGVFPGAAQDEGEDGGERRAIYLHGYVSSRLMREGAKATDGGDAREEDEESGVRVSVAATLLDGIVLALTPNHHSCNYRSAVAFGRARVVTDTEERLWAMELITDNLVPGRWAATRYPNAAELRATAILRVDIASASAKVRAGTTGEDRGDLKDMDVRNRVWAGVVPAHLVWGEPVPAPTNLVKPVPEYIDGWRRDTTQESREYAYAAAN